MHLNPVSVTAGFYTTPEGRSAGYPGYQGSRQCPMGKWAVFRTQVSGIERDRDFGAGRILLTSGHSALLIQLRFNTQPLKGQLILKSLWYR
jgi:hypothetical protein